MRIWHIDSYAPDGRGDKIAEALRGLVSEKFTVLDVACGYGNVLNDMKKHFPKMNEVGIDINKYYEWETMGVKLTQVSLQEYTKIDTHFDVIMVLDSYRNWSGPEKEAFDAWVSRNATYFITSGDNAPRWKSIEVGKDTKGFIMNLYYVNQSI